MYVGAADILWRFFGDAERVVRFPAGLCRAANTHAARLKGVSEQMNYPRVRLPARPGAELGLEVGPAVQRHQVRQSPPRWLRSAPRGPVAAPSIAPAGHRVRLPSSVRSCRRWSERAAR